MRLVGYAMLVALAGVVGCDSESFDRGSYRTARQSRSALALAKYIKDDLHSDHKDDSRALLDKHFELALSSVEEGPAGELQRRLLTALRAAGEPRIGVRMYAPELSSELSPSARKYFDDTSGVYDFADGASLGAIVAFPNEVLVFANPASYGFDELDLDVWVDVEWSVHPSGAVFSGPSSFASITSTPEPVQGIGIEATLTFTISERALDPRTASGEARAGFEYSSMMGFADEGDMYGGMAEGSFAEIIGQVLD